VEWFTNAGWMFFCHGLKGFGYEVARAFAEGFDGQVVNIAELSLSISEESIAEAVGLPIDGEIWFKNRTLIGIDIDFFLKDEPRDENWR